MNYKEEPIYKWNDLVKKEKEHRNDPGKEEWIFRGHVKQEYRLQTCLERAIADIGIITNNNASVCEIENGLIRRFKRQYYHFNLSAPENDDVIEWLAVMQHYGAPTRLLDWTYSFYIAAFFALEEAKGACALWALETKSLTKKAESVLPNQKRKLLESDRDIRKCKTWMEIFRNEKPHALAYPVNPFRLNERLVLQQGIFLCPGNISMPFETNLSAVLPENDKSDCKLYKYIINFDVEERQRALLQLHRMNINRATLFPGMEGFAKSLKTLLISPAHLLHPAEGC